jgi:hypothetical protein
MTFRRRKKMRRDQQELTRQTDGICVVRTRLSWEAPDEPDTARSYTSLRLLERAFAASGQWIGTSGQSIVDRKIVSAQISRCACWRIVSNGIAAGC